MKKLFTLLMAALLSLPLISQVERKVIVEHFTNSRCSSCASKNPAFYETLESYPDVLHIAYHPSSPYPNCVFNQHNPAENDHRAYFYDVYGSTPRVVVQGSAIPSQNPLINPQQIDEHVGEASDYKINMTKSELSDDQHKITLEIERVSGTVNEVILIYAGLAEKLVEYAAPNGEDIHHDVFRKVIFFDTANIHPVGEKKIIEYQYSTQADWNESEIYSFAIIHDGNSLAVKQAGSSLESPSGVGAEQIEELSNVLYPNPTTGMVNINSKYRDRFGKFEFYDLTGKRVKVFETSGNLDISELDTGLYFVRITERNGRVYSTRLLKY